MCYTEEIRKVKSEPMKAELDPTFRVGSEYQKQLATNLFFNGPKANEYFGEKLTYSIQDSAARIVTNTRNYDHITAYPFQYYVNNL